MTNEKREEYGIKQRDRLSLIRKNLTTEQLSEYYRKQNERRNRKHAS